MPTIRLPFAVFVLTLAVATSMVPGQVIACDSDNDCGVGGTCIKREKRARGVCYGGNDAAADQSVHSNLPTNHGESSNPTSSPNHSPSGDAPIFGEEGYVEPSAGPRMIEQLNLPGRDSGSCISTTDCAGGQECIYRDPMLGHGSCENPPQ